MNFETTDKEKNMTKGEQYVYELYAMSGGSNKNVQYDMEFDRTILKYGVTNNPHNRYGAGNMKKDYNIRMNVLNSDICRGEAFYLESFYAMEYAKKYGKFPIDMDDRYGWQSEAIDIEWSEEYSGANCDD